MIDFNPGMLVIPLSGAAIGLVTNWIAIKMLFRPYGQKRLFGVVLPFTPGVMPKRRAELAKKLGRTVGGHILTDEVLAKAMVEPGRARALNDLLGRAIDHKITEAANSKISVEEFVKNHIPGGGELVDSAVKRMTAELRMFVRSGAFRAELVTLLHEKMVDYTRSGAMEQRLTELLSANLNNLRERICAYADVYDIPAKLMGNDSPVSEYLGENLAEAQAAVAEAAAKHVPAVLARHLRDNAELNERLEALTRRVMDDSLGSFARAFVSPSKVYASIRENTLEMLANEDEMRRISERAAQGVLVWLQRPVSFYATALQNHAPKLNVHIDGFAQGFADFLLEKSQSVNLAELIDSHCPTAWEELRVYMDRQFEAAAERVSELAATGLESRLRDLLGRDVSYFAENIRAEDVDKLKAVVSEMLKNAPERLAPLVAASLDIDKLVEDQVNGFGIEKMEALVMSVVRRELGIVISLGGVLGFVIGIAVMAAQFVIS